MEQDIVYVLLFLYEEQCVFLMKVPGIFGISLADRSSTCSAPGELQQVELSNVAIRYQSCRTVFLMFVPLPISLSTEVATEGPNSSSLCVFDTLENVGTQPRMLMQKP